MPTFRDSENKIMMVPEGDYIFCVIGFDCKVSSGGKTAGSDQYEVEMEIEPKGSRCWETLTDHELTAWKIDCFLKSAGVKLAKGEDYEFRKDIAEQRGVRWINPIGLRGPCKLVVEEYPVGSGKRRNKVAIFYTDKAKLPRREIEEQPEEERPF